MKPLWKWINIDKNRKYLGIFSRTPTARQQSNTSADMDLLVHVNKVAACGDCNIMKYKWDLEDFLQHCRKVARFHNGIEFADSEAEEVEEACHSPVAEDAGMQGLNNAGWIGWAWISMDLWWYLCCLRLKANLVWTWRWQCFPELWLKSGKCQHAQIFPKWPGDLCCSGLGNR